MDTNDTRPIGYFHGDEMRYTGKIVELDGWLFFECEIVEGRRKGEMIVTQLTPTEAFMAHIGK